MYIESLILNDFRNISTCEIVAPSSGVLLEGKNGQGKTNILEALYLCITGRSFRTHRIKEMVAHQAQSSRLRAVFVRAGIRHLIQVYLEDKKRVITVDDKRLQVTSSLLQLLNVVSFFPDDLRIIKASPEERRSFLDRAVMNMRTDFLSHCVAYNKALKTRNGMLKHRKLDMTYIRVLDEQLVTYGSQIYAMRQDVLNMLAPLASQIYQDVACGDDPAPEFSLSSGLGLGCGSGVFSQEAFARLLKERWERDMATGTTSVGPHRSDIDIRFDETHHSKPFASQGQQRTLVLALKLAEVRLLKQKLGSPPILLLDDVSSELDRDRCKALFEDLQKSEAQVWLSTTGAAPLPVPIQMQHYHVNKGTLVRQDS